MSGSETEADVLGSKRTATRYQILVEIAERQPAVSQQEIAAAIGVTPQAVSDNLQDLVAEGFVESGGRGRYEVTNEGVDWLIGRTDALREYVAHVSDDVIEEVEVDSAIATADISEGETVSLSMRDGVQRATPGAGGSATAVAVTDARAGRDVGVTNWEGVLEYELGTVTVLAVPEIQRGGSDAVPPETVRSRAAAADLVAVAGTEARAAAAAAGLSPDVEYGTPTAVQEAATRGQDVLLLAVTTTLSAHTDRLREHDVGYEVLDPTEA
jgi:putative transcriptional regulator